MKYNAMEMAKKQLKNKKNKSDYLLQIKALSIISLFLLVFVLSIGLYNLVDFNSNVKNITNTASANDEDISSPENPGGGSLELPTVNTDNQSSQNDQNQTDNSTDSNDTQQEQTSNQQTSQDNTSTPVVEQTPPSLEGGQGTAINLGGSNDSDTTSTSNNSQNDTTVPQNQSPTPTPTNTQTYNSTTVRSGGLEFTVAILAVIALIGFAYYYRVYGHKKGSLKTTEKKIAKK